MDYADDVRATYAMRALDAARSHVVMIETAGRRSTGSRVEISAPVLIVDGRAVRADVDPAAWREALDASEIGR